MWGVTVVSLVNVEKSYGSWPVLRGVDFEVADDARIGIVGPNGAGKSTLLRILQGSDPPTAGEVVRRKDLVIAYLEQHVDGDERTAEQTVLAARPDVAALDAEMRGVEAELGRPEVVSDLARMDRVLMRQHSLLDRWVEAGGAGLAGEARAMLVSLGFDDADLALPTTSLSGGQRKLVALAACLIRQPDLLLLDEPETHLDAERRARLESIVAELPGAVVTVSHDRYMLDETVTRIAELDDGRVTMWPGNYFGLRRRQGDRPKAPAADLRHPAEGDRPARRGDQRFEFWARIVVNKRHITQAHNKQRQIDRMEKVERPVFERRKIALEMRSAERGGSKVVTLSDVTVAFGGAPVLRGCDVQIFRGERIGMIGADGTGNSVLGTVLAGLREPDEGNRSAGPSVQIGYLAQGHETEPPDRTPIHFVRDMKPMYEEDAVALLGRFLFRYDQMRQPVGTLSGGERTRLQLCLLMLSGANCLLLDEPTNHLDIDSMEVLEAALESYDGTVIVISHDRYLLDRIPDRIVEVRTDGRSPRPVATTIGLRRTAGFRRERYGLGGDRA